MFRNAFYRRGKKHAVACVPERKDPRELQCGFSFIEMMSRCDCDDSNIHNHHPKGWWLQAHRVVEIHSNSEPWGQPLAHSSGACSHTLAYLTSCALGELNPCEPPHSSVIRWKSEHYSVAFKAFHYLDLTCFSDPSP